MSENATRLTTSDETLLEQARLGDQRAFAELWRRHYRSGVHVARQFTSSLDADDLVSEAYTRIYQRVVAGGGPSGAFRPYLYTTIRNLASSWGAASREVQVDEIADFEDPSTLDDPAAVALDRTLTARAFRTLPERWQSVLWYTEVEGMDPHEVAPILGISANSVAALSYRAREGLRKAWLQAHITDATASGRCQWTISRLGDHARKGLTERESLRVTEHLAECTKCSIIGEEVEEVGSHLAMILLPILLGGVAGGTLLSASSAGGSAMAAGLPDIPAIPGSFEVIATATSVAAPVVAGLSMGAATGTGALVGSLAVVAVVGGSVAFGLAPRSVEPLPLVRESISQPLVADPAGATSLANPAGVELETTVEVDPLTGETTTGTDVGTTTPDATSPGSTSGTATPEGVSVAPAPLTPVPGPSSPTPVSPSDVSGVIGSLGGTVDGVVGGVTGTVNSVGGAVGSTLGGVVGGLTGTVGSAVGGPVGELVSGVGDTVVGALQPGAPPAGHTAPGGSPVSADVNLNLSGTGVPGAIVSAQATGVVYATTKVGSDGKWSLLVSALPDGLDSLGLSQNLKVLGITLPLKLPLTLDTGPLGIVIKLFNK